MCVVALWVSSEAQKRRHSSVGIEPWEGGGGRDRRRGVGRALSFAERAIIKIDAAMAISGKIAGY